MALLEPYRIAPGNKIPVPMPIERRRVSELGQTVFANTENAWRGILEAHGIHLHSAMSFSIWRRGFSEEAKDTLILSTGDSSDNGEHMAVWHKAVTAVYNLIRKTADRLGLQFRVEIRNEAHRYKDASFGIPQGTALAQVLSDIQEIVTAKVAAFLPGIWRSVSCRMRGRRDDIETHRPTIMILVTPKSSHFWGILFREIEQAITAFKTPDIEVFLEIATSLLHPAVLSKDLEPPLPEAQYPLPDIAKNGASIGPRSTLDAGSLGVWLWFYPKDNAEKKACFLTCYHVVANGEKDRIRRRRNDTQGIGRGGVITKKPIKIDYPAPFDHNVTKETIQKAIEAQPEPQQLCAQSMRTLDRYRSADGIGYVEYASGVRKNLAGHRMDWALVMVNEEIMLGQNHVPIKPEFSHAELFFGLVTRPEWSLDQVVSDFAAPKSGDWVIKTGRSTHGRVGKVMGSIKADVNIPSTGFISKEFFVMDALIGHAFAMGGDSGSMVVNHEGKWVGIVTSVDPLDDITFITTSNAIMEDIEEHTGGGKIMLA